MTPTELRDTLASVSDAVPVPTPDSSAFERRVTGVRRRRTAVRVAGAAAAVAVVASGSTLALSLGDGPGDRTAPTHETPAQGPHSVPVVVDGHFHMVDGSGGMGPEGPAAEAIVGTTPHGVVVITSDETLVLIDEESSEVQPLVPGKVGRAYLDGDAVVYQDSNGLIQWWGIEPSVASTNSAQTPEGWLLAATTGRVVVADGPNGSLSLASWDADGQHELPLQDVTQVSRVETAGDVIAVHTEDGVTFFSPDGLHSSTSYVGERVGALAPDGLSYAQQTKSRKAVELVDPATLDITPVEGPAGPISDLGWAPDGDLLAVVDQDGARTLWRCTPSGTGCAAQVEDPTGTFHLGDTP